MAEKAKMHSLKVKTKAIELRKAGFTYREISKKLTVSLGTLSDWTKHILLTPAQKFAIQKRRRQHVFTPEEKLKAVERLGKFRFQYSPKELLHKVKLFHDRYGRIPLKREFNMYAEYRRHFGSWNNAIRLAGFNPNKQLFTFRMKASDGHVCDSYTEMIIDNWLFSHGICHERNKIYGQTKLTADFALSDGIVMEFFGLKGVNKEYDRNLQRKKLFCKQNKVKLIEIYPSMFENGTVETCLEKILTPYVNTRK